LTSIQATRTVDSMSAWSARRMGRRWLLVQTGRGVVGVAVLGMAACSASEPSATDSGSPSPSESTNPSDAAPSESDPGAAAVELAWSRVNLGFVSAYVLVRGREAAVVDTGVAGSVDAIVDVLDEAGPGVSGVRHVILTHKHPDHAGSINEVLAATPKATGYVGTADLSEVDATQRLTPLDDGDEVFGLQLVGTPGHTAGHLAVFDPDTGVLVAGDALTNMGQLAGSNPQFTEDELAAAESVRKLAQLAPRTILVGHGEPVVDGASAALEELARSLS
jgi:glyoxylase-like metal-dependent hydrolase (beta-lactamase superfamily II)